MNERLELDLAIPLDRVTLYGTLAVPKGSFGLVLFAHGSGSSRQSPRNQFVANALQGEGLATLLMDLLTVEEQEIDAQEGMIRFDVEPLADRLAGTVDWLQGRTDVGHLPIGLFGASTGAAAALIAAARRPGEIQAVVSRGGRPDLAGRFLGGVSSPSLFIVGGLDRMVLSLNYEALQRLGSTEKAIKIVRGAGHLFEESGALEQVAQIACDWFRRHLRDGQSSRKEEQLSWKR